MEKIKICRELPIVGTYYFVELDEGFMVLKKKLEDFGSPIDFSEMPVANRRLKPETVLEAWTGMVHCPEILVCESTWNQILKMYKTFLEEDNKVVPMDSSIEKKKALDRIHLSKKSAWEERMLAMHAVNF